MINFDDHNRHICAVVSYDGPVQIEDLERNTVDVSPWPQWLVDSQQPSLGPGHIGHTGKTTLAYQMSRPRCCGTGPAAHRYSMSFRLRGNAAAVLLRSSYYASKHPDVMVGNPRLVTAGRKRWPVYVNEE